MTDEELRALLPPTRPVELKSSRELVRLVLKLAMKELASDVAEAKADKKLFICFAISLAESRYTTGPKDCTPYDDARTVIQSRLPDAVSVVSYLRQIKSEASSAILVDYETGTGKLIQRFRKLWLESLIEEFSQ